MAYPGMWMCNVTAVFLDSIDQYYVTAMSRPWILEVNPEYKCATNIGISNKIAHIFLHYEIDDKNEKKSRKRITWI